MNNLGDFFRDRRIERGLSLTQLARLVGYRNLNKGMRNILRFERDGTIRDDLLVALAEALEVDWCIVEELTDKDRQERLREWKEWANEPIPMYMVVRYMAAVYGKKPLPRNRQRSTPASTPQSTTGRYVSCSPAKRLYQRIR